MCQSSNIRTVSPADQGAAYGLCLRGIAPQYLSPTLSSEGFPEVDISLAAAAPAQPEAFSAVRAVIPLADRELALINRVPASARYHRADEDDGSLVHPFLTIVGTVFAWWLGRDALHAGAFSGPEATIGVLGPRGAGKSTLLAALAVTGVPVVTDDLLVIEDGRAFAGPRCVDLRPGTAERLALGGDLRQVRGGERTRWRQPALDDVPALRGWVALAWGPPALVPLRPRERLEILRAHYSLPHRASRGLLDLAALPAWRLSRPKDWDGLQRAVERLRPLTDR